VSTATRTAPAAARRRRPRIVRPLLGVAMLIAGGCLVSLFGFHVSRSPSECGGAAGPCPDGLVVGIAGFFATIFLLAPVGTALLVGTLHRAFAVAVALTFGGASAGLYVAGFVAEPVSDSTVGYAIGAAVTGLIALPAVWVVVRPPAGPEARARIARKVAELERRRAELQGDATGGEARPGGDADRARGATGRAGGPGSTGTVRSSKDAAASELHDLLVHGLAAGALGTDRATTPADDASRARVVHLIDLHRRGVLTDDEVAAALRAVRQADGG